MADEPVPFSPVLLEGALELADAMNQAQVRHALIGGLATGFRTEPRFTRDVDFLLNVPQIALPSLLDDLSRRGFAIDHLATIREWTQHHLATMSYRGTRVDWLRPMIPLYQHVLDRASKEIWHGHLIYVASSEGLILTKLLANRTQDLADIEKLVAVHRDTLDLEWIRAEWQSIASLDDPRMVRFLALVSGENRSLSNPI